MTVRQPFPLCEDGGPTPSTVCGFVIGVGLLGPVVLWGRTDLHSPDDGKWRSQDPSGRV